MEQPPRAFRQITQLTHFKIKPPTRHNSLIYKDLGYLHPPIFCRKSSIHKGLRQISHSTRCPLGNSDISIRHKSIWDKHLGKIQKYFKVWA